jgi:hypothetical protein
VRPLSTVFQIKYDAVLVSSAESQTLITLKGFSMKTLTGINITKDKLVSDRSFVLPMTFFAKIARKAEETLDNIAAMNPSHVKLKSDADAIPTPPTIGMSDA